MKQTKERSDVISYGRRIPTTSGGYKWIGIHPLGFDAKKLRRVMGTYTFTDEDKEDEDELKEFMEGDDVFNSYAISAIFSKLCVLIDEFAVFNTVPTIEEHDDAKVLLIVPGSVMGVPTTDSSGKKTIEVPAVKDKETGETKPMDWLIPFSSNPNGDYDDDLSSKTFMIATYDDERFVYTVRTSSWFVRDNKEEMVKALLDAAHFFVGVARSCGFSLENCGMSKVSVVRMEDDSKDSKDSPKFIVLVVAMIFCKGDSRPRTQRQQKIEEMVSVIDALVTPVGTTLDTETGTVVPDK